MPTRITINNTAVLVVAAAIFGLVFGFAYGNLLGVQYGFQVKDWQTFGAMLVALAAAAVAYIGVRNTQRITVMIREQDRIDDLLPGLRQVNELLMVIRGPLNAMRPQHRYQAALLLDAAIKVQPGESVEDSVRRQLPLADHHLRWEVTEIVFALKSQAAILEVGEEELEKYQTDVANIHEFAASEHEGLREAAAQVKNSYDRENEKMARAIRALDEFAELIKERISKAEARRVIIRAVVDKFFESGS